MLSPCYFALASAFLLLTEAAKCPKGAFKVIGENDCYLLRTTPATNSDAGGDCKQLNGMLPSVPNAFVNALLAARTPAEGVWLGGSYTTFYDLDEFLWDDGTIWAYDHWDRGEPSNLLGSFILQPNGRWTTDGGYRRDDTQTKPYFCKVAPLFEFPAISNKSAASTQQCQDGWTYLQSADRCARRFDKNIAWFDALSKCRNLGGDLVNIPNAAVDREVSGLLLDHRNSTIFSYAIGLYSPTREDAQKGTKFNWTWTGGSPAAYTPWEDVHADQCGYMTFSSANGNDGGSELLWTNANCEYLAYTGYICEAPTYTSV